MTCTNSSFTVFQINARWRRNDSRLIHHVIHTPAGDCYMDCAWIIGLLENGRNIQDRTWIAYVKDISLHLDGQVSSILVAFLSNVSEVVLWAIVIHIKRMTRCRVKSLIDKKQEWERESDEIYRGTNLMLNHLKPAKKTSSYTWTWAQRNGESFFSSIIHWHLGMVGRAATASFR